MKRDLKTRNWSRLSESLRCLVRNEAPAGTPLERARRVAGVGLKGPGTARQLVATRCERGAEIARMLEFPEATAAAIRALDEHWDGRGHPDGRRGEEIPRLGRILGLAQTVEVFVSTYGVAAAGASGSSRR